MDWVEIVATGGVGVAGAVVGAFVNHVFSGGERKQQQAHDDAVRDETWQREERLAERSRVRDSLVRDLHATRDQCVATLNNAVFGAMGGTDVAASREVMGEKYSTADPGLIGDKGTVIQYLGLLGRLTAHPRGTAFPAELSASIAQVSSAIKARIREQESRANRDETVNFIAEFRASDMTADDRSAMVALGILSPVVASYLDEHSPAIS
jgi:hypothetical protein